MLQRSLQIEQRFADGKCVLRLEGPLVMATMSKLYDMVRADGSPLLIIDLTAVPFIDSAGIGALVAAYVTRHNSERKLALVGANERVRNSLKVAWVDQLFRFFESVEAASAGQ